MSNEKETREILNKTIAESQSVIDKAKADLAELDKPKYRFGDYGTAIASAYGEKINIIYKRHINNGDVYYPWVSDLTVYLDEELSNIQIFGNCIDDLKRNQVDLKEFQFRSTVCPSSGFYAFIYNDGLAIGDINDVFTYTLDQSLEIHKKLGQVIATKQRSLKQ